MKYFLILLLAVAFFIISITLGSSNDQVITFNYLIAKGDFSLSSLLALLFGVGFVLGWLICAVFYLRTVVSLKNARRKIKRLESQLEVGDKKTSESTSIVTVQDKE
ncbi:MAG: LapA family protein [Providencia sp.]|uniref:LapA family protein n=1 Tax=Providencia sp. TaxID=589 RepID=UPI003F9BFC4D